MSKNNTLSEKKIIAIQELMRSRTCVEAARAAGCGKRLSDLYSELKYKLEAIEARAKRKESKWTNYQ